MLGLAGNAQLPEFNIHIPHKGADPLPDNAEVVVVHLLSLGGRRTIQRSACEENILSLQCLLGVDQKVFLLRAHGRDHLGCVCIAEQSNDTDCLLAQCLHGAKQGCLLVQCFSCVGTEGGGNAKGRAGSGLLDKGWGGDIPGGIASRLKGRTKSAGGEAGGIRFSLDQLLAGKLHDHPAILIRMGHEGIVLFRCDAGQRLKPVGVMGCPILNRPVLHGLCHHICRRRGQLAALVDDVHDLFIGALGQSLLHLAKSKDFTRK